jgi:hypothetical protein
MSVGTLMKYSSYTASIESSSERDSIVSTTVYQSVIASRATAHTCSQYTMRQISAVLIAAARLCECCTKLVCS